MMSPDGQCDSRQKNATHVNALHPGWQRHLSANCSALPWALLGQVSMGADQEVRSRPLVGVCLLCFAHRQSFEIDLPSGNVNSERLSVLPASNRNRR